MSSNTIYKAPVHPDLQYPIVAIGITEEFGSTTNVRAALDEKNLPEGFRQKNPDIHDDDLLEVSIGRDFGRAGTSFYVTQVHSILCPHSRAPA